MVKIQASEFKAKCLGVLDKVERTGESVIILKRGRPVAQLIPFVSTSDDYPQRTLKGTVEILGDIISPVLPPSDWNATQEDS